MAASKNECGSPQLAVSDSDEGFSDFSSGSSDNYIPDETDA
jgi:hypothetical protein